MSTVSPTRAYIQKNTRKAKVLLTEKDTGLVLIMNRPADMNLDDGLGNNQPVMEIDEQGYQTKVANNFSSREPTVNLSFSERNLDILALSLNRKTKQVVATLKYPARQQIKKASYNPSEPGKLGYRVKKNAETQASFHDAATGETKLLIQQDFDSFNSAIDNSFAVGEHFERKFSNNLVNLNYWVGLKPSADYQARSLSEASIGYLELDGLCFYIDDSIEIIKIDDCFVNPEGAGLKAGETTVNLDVSSLGKCQPWNVYKLTDQIFCDD